MALDRNQQLADLMARLEDRGINKDAIQSISPERLFLLWQNGDPGAILEDFCKNNPDLPKWDPCSIAEVKPIIRKCVQTIS